MRVDRWALEGPFPEQVAATPFTAPGPWGALLAEAVGQRAGLVVPTEAPDLRRHWHKGCWERRSR